MPRGGVRYLSVVRRALVWSADRVALPQQSLAVMPHAANKTSMVTVAAAGCISWSCCRNASLALSAKLPTGLYVLLALISFFYYEQSYLSIYWTDFNDLFTKKKLFAWIFLIQSSFSNSSRDDAMATNFVSYRTCLFTAKITQDPLNRFSQSLQRTVGIELQMITTFYFFQYLKGRCHGNQFSGKMRQNYLPLHLSLCHSDTEWAITISMWALTVKMMPLNRVKISSKSVQ